MKKMIVVLLISTMVFTGCATTQGKCRYSYDLNGGSFDIYDYSDAELDTPAKRVFNFVGAIGGITILALALTFYGNGGQRLYQ